MTHPCEHCGADNGTKRCSRCHNVWYCGVKCQREDWKAGHRESCLSNYHNSMAPEKDCVNNQPPVQQNVSTQHNSSGDHEVELTGPAEDPDGIIPEEYAVMAKEMGEHIHSGQMLLHSGRFRDAAKAFEQGEVLVLQLLQHLPDKSVSLNLARVEALRGKGCAYLQLNTQQAYKFLNQSLSLINQLKILNNLSTSQYEKLTLSEADCYDNLGTQKLIEDNAVAALCHFNQSLAIMKRIGNTEGQLVSYGNIGLALQQLNRLDEALEMQNREIELARKAFEETGEGVFNSYVASALNNSGSIYLGKGENELALSCFKEACQLSHESQNISCQRDALVNLVNHTPDITESRGFAQALTELQMQGSDYESQVDCSVCLENLNSNLTRRLYIAPQCEHVFHKECWDSQKQENGNLSFTAPCPLCSSRDG